MSIKVNHKLVSYFYNIHTTRASMRYLVMTFITLIYIVHSWVRQPMIFFFFQNLGYHFPVTMISRKQRGSFLVSTNFIFPCVETKEHSYVKYMISSPSSSWKSGAIAVLLETYAKSCLFFTSCWSLCLFNVKELFRDMKCIVSEKVKVWEKRY